MSPSRCAVLFILGLAACSSTPPAPAPLDYGQLNKINLDIRDLSFVDRGVDEQLQGPNVANQFQPTIAEAVHRWASERLQAVGVAGQAAFVVKNAYVTEQDLPTTDSWFERQQAHKYIGHVEVEFDARGSEGYALATANATRSVSVSEDATDDEKEAAYNALLSGLMQDLDQYLDQAIHDHLRDFIVTAPVIGGKLPPVPELPGLSP